METVKIVFAFVVTGGLIIALVLFVWRLGRPTAKGDGLVTPSGAMAFVAKVILGLAGLGGAWLLVRYAWRAPRTPAPTDEVSRKAQLLSMLSEHVPPAPEAWTPEVNARLRWLVRGKPEFVGDAVICPLIPCRMQEIFQLTEHESGAVPADLLEAKQLASGPMGEFLSSLESFAIRDPEDRERVERDLVERLMKANQEIGRPERATIVEAWWLRRQLRK